MDELMFPRNNARVAHQKTLDIRVVVGNPPYSKGQSSANDNNANIKYPTLDAAIERTYAARSSATNKNWLYDSYIRAIRWASDRIGNEGVLAYVCNGGGRTSNLGRASMQVEATRMYRVREVAEHFEVSVATIYRAIESGQLGALKLGTGRGALRVPGTAVTAFTATAAAGAAVVSS